MRRLDPCDDPRVRKPAENAGAQLPKKAGCPKERFCGICKSVIGVCQNGRMFTSAAENQSGEMERAL